VNDTNDVVRKKIRKVDISIKSLNVRKRRNRYIGYLCTLLTMLSSDANGRTSDVGIDADDSQPAPFDLLEKA